MTPATQEGTERAQAGETPSPRVEDDGQRRVLLVEDSAADRALIQRMLRGSEYRDVEASRIADAIAHCVEAGPPDAVLLDLGLPDASGMDAVVAMRRAAPRTPIVVLTGNTLPEAGREAVRSGADDYLVKDALDADRLQRTLSLAIERAQRTQMTERLAVAEGLASLGRLAASVAHDVNNPTTYARANLEIVSRHLEVLRAEHPDARLDDAARLVAEARVGIDHVVSIVADLRALGRISERTPERVDLASVVRTACRLTRNELYHRARVNVEVEEGIGIAAYRTRLLQAISNVLLNAAQSFEAGRASKNTVEVRLRKVGEAVEIAIRDTGRGMPPHLLARAFEPFFTARADGTGLGLALVREIVEEHEGTVRIESEVG
ncbi:MAG: response regulator, partial [Myxococcales bacterium]|nr:response regulator [Myxococcales bacterium]